MNVTFRRLCIKFKMLRKLLSFRTVQLCSCVASQKPPVRWYCQKNSESANQKLGDLASKYDKFKDEDAEIILDVYEERLKYDAQLDDEPEVEDVFAGINLERGVRGVFEIEDLVDVLRRENAQNVFVALLPPEFNYVDYMCIVSGKSYRHMQALSQFVRKVFKKKCHTTDIIPKLEGANSKDWMALDLGNIALHIFSNEARAKYDLETLWSVGPEYDAEFNKKDPIVEMLEMHSVYLKDLKPAKSVKQSAQKM